MDDLNGTALYAGIIGIMAVALALNKFYHLNVFGEYKFHSSNV